MSAKRICASVAKWTLAGMVILIVALALSFTFPFEVLSTRCEFNLADGTFREVHSLFGIRYMTGKSVPSFVTKYLVAAKSKDSWVTVWDRGFFFPYDLFAGKDRNYSICSAYGGVRQDIEALEEDWHRKGMPEDQRKAQTLHFMDLLRERGRERH